MKGRSGALFRSLCTTDPGLRAYEEAGETNGVLLLFAKCLFKTPISAWKRTAMLHGFKYFIYNNHVSDL